MYKGAIWGKQIGNPGYKLRAILMGVGGDGLIKANEEFAAWLTGERSMPFGEHGEHVTVRLIDFEDLERNQYVVTTQFTYRAGASEKRADLVLLVNGIPRKSSPRLNCVESATCESQQ